MGKRDVATSGHLRARGRSASAWERLTTDDHRVDPAECVRLWSRVRAEVGAAALEARVEAAWARLPGNARRNVAYAAHDAEAVSTELLVRLFHHADSTVEDRHRLLAALAASASDRAGAAAEVRALADDVGRYADARRQRLLNRFLENVREAFPA